ncbi:hypothetical protein SLEP1_g32414 [Rubroshorea leprosula]|uniref:Uncharacterized protein n=1 Tax=Rubroshorea leprosula TaxID=152421 RepID=A0AAV5KD71_9ROSI|nr:hypothetical protein SLEP1_g32414 [Rubroshorea leprosula]
MFLSLSVVVNRLATPLGIELGISGFHILGSRGFS